MVNPMGTALSGLKTFEKKLRVTANNIANVNTTGFKASRATSQDVAPQAISTSTGAAQLGRGSCLSGITSNFSQGALEPNDSPTDLAIGGKGFFVLRNPEDPGNVFYTRTGIFRLDQENKLTTPAGFIAQGWPVGSNGQPLGSLGDISLSCVASTTVSQSANGYEAGILQTVFVDTDGIVTGRYSNGEVMPLFQVALADFQNMQGLSKEGGGLFRETRQSGAPVIGAPCTQGLGSISSNALEQSNVDITEEVVNTITTQHGFQANTKMVRVADEMIESVIDLFA